MMINTGVNVSFLTVFLEGILSFFSPCVLPLLPVYIGYLSGGALKRSGDHEIYDRKKVILHTVFFVVGISFAYFILGLGMSAIGTFFSSNKLLFARVGGVAVILFGLYQLGIFGQSRILGRELRMPLTLEKMSMSPAAAFVMGFILSFAWTPCVGPVLASVLLLAASSSSHGLALIGAYTLGYVIPFLAAGIFTTTLLGFFNRHRNIVRYTVKIGGILLILMGILMLTGKMNSLTGYLSDLSGSADTPAVEETEGKTLTFSEDTEEQAAAAAEESEEQAAAAAEESEAQAAAVAEETEAQDTAAAEETEAYELTPAVDFTLADQYGDTHRLSDYKGRIIFLNFWATWCPPCRAELPYIQELYEEYQEKEDPEVVFLGVAFPGHGGEEDADGIAAFLEENGYTYPVLMDEGATLASPYYITAYPTTYLIDPDGYVLGYITGGMSKETMEDVIRQAKELSGF